MSLETTRTNTEFLIPFGETLLCLGQAFLTPKESERATALRDDLVPDLEALREQTGVPAAGELHALASALRSTADAEGGLLRVYSRLFLAPPFPAPLNAGIQMDGALMGQSTVEMERFYQRHGLTRDREFRDLPDHLALQLQFVAFLHAKAAETEDPEERGAIAGDARYFVRQLMLSWFPEWLKQLDEAVAHLPTADAWRQLGRVTRDVLEADVAHLEALAPEVHAETVARPTLEEALDARMAPERSLEAPAACRVCGKEFAMGRDMVFMLQQLQARGLETEHLEACPDCRAGEMGLSATTVELPAAVSKHV